MSDNSSRLVADITDVRLIFCCSLKHLLAKQRTQVPVYNPQQSQIKGHLNDPGVWCRWPSAHPKFELHIEPRCSLILASNWSNSG